ncbi:MAG: hypothetical protein QW270_01795 [Candidatus Bathyarchaeia archaeon]
MTNEAKKEDKNEHSRISVRLGEFQIELEGTHANVLSLMGKPLYEFIKELQKVVGEIPSVEEVKTVEEVPPTEYPPPLGKPSTLGEALRKLMVETGWGRKPRSLGEIMTALETNGLYHKPATVATTLVYLVKNGTLRRLGSRGNFKYVAA